MAEKKFRTIPLDIFYNNELEFGARFLYAEIDFLSYQKGHCWAANDYFADKFGVKSRTIQKWLHDLESNSLIKREFITEELKTKRRITPLVKMKYTVVTKAMSWVPKEIKKVYE